LNLADEVELSRNRAPTRWPKWISVYIPLNAGVSHDTADPDRGLRIW